MKSLSIKSIGWIIVSALIVIGIITVLAGGIILSNIDSVSSTWKKFQAGRSEKVRAVNALRRELGYGGLTKTIRTRLTQAKFPAGLCTPEQRIRKRIITVAYQRATTTKHLLLGAMVMLHIAVAIEVIRTHIQDAGKGKI